MKLDDAIEQVKAKISAVSKGAEMKAVKMSDEEARLTVLAPKTDLQVIKDITFRPVLDLLNNYGLDIQVLVYDKDAPPLDV
jgi:hypothetical protein